MSASRNIYTIDAYLVQMDANRLLDTALPFLSAAGRLCPVQAGGRLKGRFINKIINQTGADGYH